MVPDAETGPAMKAETARKKKVFTVELRQDWCKGCYLCIDVCPVAGIFTTGGEIGPKGFKPVRVDPEGCTGCMLCELLCPDLAITVERGDETDG